MDEWIKELKAGDRVIVHGHWSETLETIDKVTSTGRIKIGTTYYDKSGHSMGGGTWDYGFSLYEATPEAVEALRQKVVIRNALNAVRNVRSLTYEQSVKIIEILHTEPQKGNETL